MSKISGTLIGEIDLKLNTLIENRAYLLKKDSSLQKELRLLSGLYSWWLEHPSERKMLLTNEGDRKKALRRARKGFKRIRSAWQYLVSLRKPLLEAFDQGLLLAVGNRVDPSNTYYRDYSVTLNLRNYTPPNYLKIFDLIERLKCNLREGSEAGLHPVELAAYLHLKITGIQPFGDCNKRTARLLQDKVLDEQGLPPAIIPPGERQTYISLLEEALAGDRDGDVNKQRNFFDYIGGKVNSELDDMIGDLKIPLKYVK